MKKIIVLTLIAALSAILPFGAYADGINVFVNGGKLEFDAAPFIENDRTLVPMRAIFEALGASVVWDDETHTVFAAQEDTVISVQINDTKAFVNSKQETLDAAAKIVNDRTFVPLRFVSESLGCNVEWDGTTQTINITK